MFTQKIHTSISLTQKYSLMYCQTYRFKRTRTQIFETYTYTCTLGIRTSTDTKIRFTIRVLFLRCLKCSSSHCASWLRVGYAETTAEANFHWPEVTDNVSWEIVRSLFPLLQMKIILWVFWTFEDNECEHKQFYRLVVNENKTNGVIGHKFLELIFSLVEKL